MKGASALVVGCGGVGSAIAASLAAAGVARLGLFDAFPASADALGSRLQAHYPKLEVATRLQRSERLRDRRQRHPARHERRRPAADGRRAAVRFDFVGEVVMKQEMTPFLRAAQAKGCAIQIGVDMLFEQIPAYLEFFGFPTTTPDELRAVASLSY